MTGGASRVRRVVYLDHTAVLSGGELALARLVGALDGIAAHVILAEPGPLEQELRGAGAEVEVLPLGDATRALGRGSVTPRSLPLGSIVATTRYVARVTGRLRALKPDLVHANSLKSGVYGSLAARLARVPIVWQVHDRIAPDYLPAPAARLVRAMLGTLPDAVVANSATTAATLGRRRRRRQTRAVVPPAVALPEPTPRATAPHPLRFGMVGRIAPWKGQLEVVRAFARAFPDGPEQLAIVGAALFGEQDYEAEVRAALVALGIAERVELRGHRHDIGAELARVDVLVHGSVIPEPFGQVVVEGMAAGLPVIATDAGGPAEIVEHEVDGLLVAPGDIEAMASAMRSLAADDATRRRLGARGPERAARFAPPVVAGAMRAVYETVLSGGRSTVSG